MTMTSLTINPEDVRSAPGGRARLGWSRSPRMCSRRQPMGETVTLTAKRRMMTPPEQVADAMGVSRPTISRRIKAGEIRAVKVGNRNRIPYEEFERYWRKTMGDLVELTRDELRDDLLGDQ